MAETTTAGTDQSTTNSQQTDQQTGGRWTGMSDGSGDNAKPKNDSQGQAQQGPSGSEQAGPEQGPHRKHSKLEEMINEAWNINFVGDIPGIRSDKKNKKKNEYFFTTDDDRILRWGVKYGPDGKPHEYIGYSRSIFFGDMKQSTINSMTELAYTRGWRTLNLEGSKTEKERMWLSIMRKNVSLLQQNPNADLMNTSYVPIYDSKVVHQFLQELADQGSDMQNLFYKRMNWGTPGDGQNNAPNSPPPNSKEEPKGNPSAGSSANNNGNENSQQQNRKDPAAGASGSNSTSGSSSSAKEDPKSEAKQDEPPKSRFGNLKALPPKEEPKTKHNQEAEAHSNDDGKPRADKNPLYDGLTFKEKAWMVMQQKNLGIIRDKSSEALQKMPDGFKPSPDSPAARRFADILAKESPDVQKEFKTRADHVDPSNTKKKSGAPKP